MNKTFQNSNEAFAILYNLIISNGYEKKDNKALYNFSFELINPTENLINIKFRNWKKKYAEREWEWFLKGDRDVSLIKKYAPIWDKMHDGNNLVWSNYGWWWNVGDQLEYVIKLLKNDHKTRKAVIVHYDPNNVKNFKMDTPCNLVLNFFINENKLYLTIFARSIDLWFGFCNDQYIFSKLLIKISNEINLKIGTITYFITNLHLYKDHIYDYK